jgi:hypothetical protein
VRLADLHLASVSPDGKIIAPEIILNASDPRIASGAVSADEAIARLDRLAANAAADIGSNTSEFSQLWRMHSGLSSLNVDVGNRSGLDVFLRKMALAKAAGFTEFNGINVQKYLNGDSAMRRLLASEDFKKLKAAIDSFAGNEEGSFSPDAAGRALQKMAGKVGKVEMIAMGIAGLSLYQIASKYGELR